MDIVRKTENGPAIVRPVSSLAGRPAGIQAPAAGFTGKDFLRILRKRKLMIILVLGFFLSAAVAGTFIWRSFWPGYKATALIEVNMNPEDPRELSSRFNVNKDTKQDRLFSVAGEAMTYNVLNGAAQRDSLTGTHWCQKLTDENQSVVTGLLAKIKATPHPKSNHVLIAMEGYGKHFQRDLPNIVNAVANELVEISATRKRSDVERKRQNLESQLLDLVNKLKKPQTQLKDKASEGPTLASQEFTLRYEVNNLKIRMLDAEAEKKLAEDQSELYQQMQSAGTLEQYPQVQMMVNGDYTVQRRQSTVDELERRYLSMAKRFPPAHRSCKAAQDEWDVAVTLLEQERQKQTKLQIDYLLSNQERLLTMTTSEWGSIDGKLKVAITQLQVISREQKTITDLKQEIIEIKKRIVDIEKTLVQFELATGSRGLAPPLRLIDAARMPEEISSPKWAMMIPLGLFLGLVVGVGVAMLLEFADSSVRTPRDLTRRSNIPMLGIVPHLDDVGGNIRDIRLACLTNPMSLIAESFRQIRTNIVFSGSGEPNRCILVTSPSPSDGKTTIAVNLAAILASGGKTALLVDTNFSQPAVAELFNQCPQGGLSEALTGEGNWQEQVHRVEDQGLSVLATGPCPANPSELLNSIQMRELVEEMKGEYDYVIIDGPPVLVVSDATSLATIADGVILSVRAGGNTHGVVKRAQETLGTVGARFVGMVLNGLQTTVGGYLQKNYDTFYKYRASGQITDQQKHQA